MTDAAVGGTAPNQWLAFRRDVTVDRLPRRAVAVIAADSKYWLWVNGQMVVFEGSLKRGPNPSDAYYDTVDLAPFLQRGENKIALLLWYFGKDGFSHKGSGRPQLFFDCPALHVTTDRSWNVRIHPAFGTADCPVPNYRLSESCVAFDARNDISGWQTAAPHDFKPVDIVENTLGQLHPRPIPMWRDEGIKAVAFETRRGVLSDTLVATLPHNIQMTPVLTVDDPQGGHRILIETNHSKVGIECLRAEYFTRQGRQEYESLGWMNGNQLILTVEHGAEVTSLAYRETGYDTTPEGHFSCSDDFYNRFWQKGLRTIYVNARDNFFDCPDRERGQWWGDIVVILGECFYTYSTSLHSLIRKGIRELCDWQRADSVLFSPIPGRYRSELPCQMLAAVGRYGFWTYYMNTGDRATILHAYPAVRRYLALYKTGADGLITFRKGDWTWGDWGDNKDMILLQNTWYCLALEGAANMAEVLGRSDEATRYRQQRQTIADAVNRICWNGNAYRHPDYPGATDDRVQALAVLAGIATPDKYEALFEVFKSEEHASPYMEKYVMEALFAIGHGDYAIERTRRRYRFMVDDPGHDTLFEGWDVGIGGNWDCGSVNHAWSGGALAVLPAMMFGIVPTEAAWRRFTVKPDPNIFRSCRLSFPTVSGTVAMTLCRDDSHISWDIEVPKGTAADVTIPWDYAAATVDGKAVTAKTLTLTPGRHEIKIKEPTTPGLPRGKDNDPPSTGREGSGADAVAPNGRSSECRPCLHEVSRVVTDEDEVNGRSSECRPCLHEVSRVVTDEDEVNPVSPEGVYIADPSARVGRDGRLYVYGSLDESTDHYCSKSYHVLSTGDLRSWQLHPHTFSDEEVLYAPDAIERDGRCYLYYDHPDGSEYVAEAETPAGPFRNPTRIEGPTQIDPNIFIDDDGQAYYFWGQFSAKGARMNADMKTLDLASMKDSIVTERDHHFHEGSYVVKRGKYYYFIYADISRRQRPTCLGYAMATAPLGPYTYKGVIIDNHGCDPDTWNNHGSIVCFNGQWYVLYHRSTHGSRTMRKACIEPIHFNDDGTIDEVEMTTQGAGKPLDAYRPIDAARACRLEGHVRIRLAGDLPKREVLAETQTGDAAEWKYIDFGEGAASVTIRVQAPTGGRLTLSAGAEKTTMADHIPIPPADQWQTVKAPVTAVKGVHALRMEFSGDMNIDTVRFEK